MRTAAQELAHHRKQLELHMKKAQADAEKAYRREHPQAGALSVMKEVRVYAKRPKGYSRHFMQVVEEFLLRPASLRETNEDTVKRLREKWFPYPVPDNALTRPIPAKALKEIGELLSNHGKQLDLGKLDTLSKIRRALRAGDTAKAGGRKYDVQVAFCDDVVVIGQIELPIQVHEKGYGRIRVGRDWLRCDVLEALFKKGE